MDDRNDITRPMILGTLAGFLLVGIVILILFTMRTG